MTRRQGRISSVVTGALLLLALGVRLAPADATVPRAPVDPSAFWTPTPTLRAEPEDVIRYQDIVDQNPFSAVRRAPSSRSEPRPASGASREPAYRLTGIVRGSGGIVALIDHDPAVPGAELYRIGDRVGAYRLSEVSDSLVVLEGGGRTLVLRLNPITGGIP